MYSIKKLSLSDWSLDLKKNRIVAITIIFSLFLTSLNAFAAVGIYEDTTWQASSSPINVTDSVVVFPEYTLTIEPGVEVIFSSGTGMEVRGNLVAVGTETDGIVIAKKGVRAQHRNAPYVVVLRVLL
jgi:hypothetical protein